MDTGEEDIGSCERMLDAHFTALAKEASRERFRLCSALCERSILGLLRPSVGTRIAVGFDHDAGKLLVEPAVVIEVGRNSSGFIATLIASVDPKLPASEGRVFVSLTSLIGGRRPKELSPVAEMLWEYLSSALAVARRKADATREPRSEHTPQRERTEARRTRREHGVGKSLNGRQQPPGLYGRGRIR
jgi:hypothetical protein